MIETICSFCKAPREKVNLLVAAQDDLAICDGCIYICNRLVEQRRRWSDVLAEIKAELTTMPFPNYDEVQRSLADVEHALRWQTVKVL